jgi:glutamyl endopeptidase
MAVKLQSVSREPSKSRNGTEAAAAYQPDTITKPVLTRKPQQPLDVTASSLRRLVVGKSDQSIQPAGRSLGAESVIGLDERTRIVSTTTAPWKFVCALAIDSPMGEFVGTGWVVAPRMLVTAGHCVFHQQQMGGWAREILVSPGQDREVKPFGTHKVVRFSTTDLWHRDQNPDFDMAALHLDEPLFGEGEGFQVGALPDNELKGFMVNVSGYPFDRGNGQEQWWAKNRIRAVTARRIFYDVDTSGGQSGGPAYILQNEKGPAIVIGIHAYGTGGTPASIPLQVNSAPRIIPEVVEQIQTWIDNGPGGTV